MARNHVIDPTYFYDCIEEFSFDYALFVVINRNKIDDSGKTVIEYSKQTIRGSLQTGGIREKRSKDGTIREAIQDFYCKSIYRIQIGDIICADNVYYRCDDILAYDEYGVRQAKLAMIQLSNYTDLREYLKTLTGEILI